MPKILSNYWFSALLGAFLTSLVWVNGSFIVVSIIGFALLLFAAQLMNEKRVRTGRYFLVLYLSFLIWNSIATWWIYHATLGGFLMAVFANSLLMYIPFLIFRWSMKYELKQWSWWILALAWISYEYIHHNWSLTWPWLSLGNAFAWHHQLIQWYEFSGVLGGTLWVFILAFLMIEALKKGDKKSKLYFAAAVILPSMLSLLIGWSISAEKSVLTNSVATEVCISQPNYNTYTEKDEIPPLQQLEEILADAEKVVTPKTDMLLMPETAIGGSNMESEFSKSDFYMLLDGFIKKHPKITIVSGLDSYQPCPDQRKPTEFAGYSQYVGYYEPYNSALVMNQKGFEIYHKSKFVPGAEQVPFPILIKPLEMILGGVGFGHFFGQKEQNAYSTLGGNKVAPSICYESIFGGHMSRFVQNDANILCVLTNDDWWNDTPGHRHHYEYARLRAIETRRPVVRSANTGFSGYFDILGNDFHKTEYRKKATFLVQVPKVASKKTFYTKFGDWIGWWAVGFTSVVILLLLIFRIKKLKSKSIV